MNIEKSILAKDHGKIKNVKIDNRKEIKLCTQKQRNFTALISFLIGILTSIVGSYIYENIIQPLLCNF